MLNLLKQNKLAFVTLPLIPFLTACVTEGGDNPTQQASNASVSQAALLGEWGRKSCLQQELINSLSKDLEVKTGKKAANPQDNCNETPLRFLDDGTMIETFSVNGKIEKQTWQRIKQQSGVTTFTTQERKGFSRTFFVSSEAGVPVLIERFTGTIPFPDGSKTFVQKHLREADLKRGYTVSGNFSYGAKNPKPNDLDFQIIQTPEQVRKKIAESQERNSKARKSDPINRPVNTSAGDPAGRVSGPAAYCMRGEYVPNGAGNRFYQNTCSFKVTCNPNGSWNLTTINPNASPYLLLLKTQKAVCVKADTPLAVALRKKDASE